MKKIEINEFVKRQLGKVGKESRFSYYEGSAEELIKVVEKNFEKKKDGYRPGVNLVPVPSAGFYSSICELDENSIIWSRMEARRKGEVPVLTKSVLNGIKKKANFVEIVIYSHDVLAENGENSTDAEYEIISINAAVDSGSQPMTPETLKRNHFGEVGGTNDGLTEEEFELKLKESESYWNRYANADNINSFKKFYDAELSTVGIEALLRENCVAKNPTSLDDFIESIR